MKVWSLTNRSHKVLEYTNTDLMPAYMFLSQYCLHSWALDLSGIGSLIWTSQDGYYPQFCCLELSQFWQGSASYWCSCWIPSLCSVRHKFSAVNLRCTESASSSDQLSPSMVERGSRKPWAVTSSNIWGQPAWLWVAAGKDVLLFMGGNFLRRAKLPLSVPSREPPVWVFPPTGLVQMRLTIVVAVFNLHATVRLALETELSDDKNNLSHRISRVKSSVAEALPHALSLSSKYDLGFDVCV